MVFDAFYIRVTFISQMSDNLNEQYFAATKSGPTCRYIVTTLQDEKYIRVATQQPSVSYNSL